MMNLSLARELSETPELTHRLRSLRFFESYFREHLDPLVERSGLVVDVDSVLLTRAFLAWVQDFTRQRDAATLDRRDYIVFTAEMLLVRLLENKPVKVLRCTPPPSLDENVREIVEFWPEGFLYSEYCLNVLQAVLRQELGDAPDVGLSLNRLANDVRVWWSFRENVNEDVARAIGFFELFIGGEPNWLAPTSAAQRPAIARAAELTSGSELSNTFEWPSTNGRSGIRSKLRSDRKL